MALKKVLEGKDENMQILWSIKHIIQQIERPWNRQKSWRMKMAKVA